MKTVSAPFLAERGYSQTTLTKTRLTISRYNVNKTAIATTWVFVNDTDVTDRLIEKGLPEIAGEIEEDWTQFKKDNLNIDLLDDDYVIRNLINQFDQIYLLKVEKGFDGIADWVTIFDGIIYPYKTLVKGRNIISITAYSMENELELHPATDSATSGANNQTITQLVNDLWDLSYINIPGGNRTIAVPPYTVPTADYTGWNAREALDNLAKIHGCVWKRTERDIAWFVTRCWINGTFNLDTDLYGKPKNSNNPIYRWYWERNSNGVHAENSSVPIEAYSVGYVNGFNIEEDNQLINTGNECYVAEEMFSGIRYNHRIFEVPSFYILELEPLDRINLTLRDKDGNEDEEIFTQFIGFKYNDNTKINELKLVERKPFLYERYMCDEYGTRSISGLNQEAQTFTLGSVSYNQAHDLVQVRLKLYKIGPIAPGTNMFVDIRTTPLPGALLGSSSMDANALDPGAGGYWYAFDYSPAVPLAAGTQYAIVVRAPTVGGGGSSVEWFYINTNAYPGGGGYYSTDGGTNWFSLGNRDYLFEEWGDQ